MDEPVNQTHPSTLQINPDVRTFLEGLLEDAGMHPLDDDMKEEMLKELYARLDTYINSVIADNLPADKLDQFIKLNEGKRPRNEIEEYLKTNIPNHGQVFAMAFAEFRDLYLGKVSVARNAPAASQDGTAS